MGAKKNVDTTANTDTIKIVSETPTESVIATDEPKKKVEKSRKVRGKKYVATRSQVDKTKLYDMFAAIELLKRLSYSKFDGTITADLVVREEGTSATLTFPHSTGKTVTVAIASDEVLAEIEAGKINFDILVTAPQFIPKLAKFARILGPRGLMPNPKNGTITPNPEAKKKELEGGKITVKAEKKQPVMHVTIGKVSMETQQLQENLTTLVDALKGKVLKVAISATMSPGIKVKI